MIDPISLGTILTSIIPVLTYGAKRVIDYKTGGATPSNSSEAVEQAKLDIEKLKALGLLDNADGASQWVINIRALQRPIVVIAVLLNWTLMTLAGLSGHLVDLQIYVIVANLASAVFFYLFGDRTLMYSLQTLNKKLTKF